VTRKVVKRVRKFPSNNETFIIGAEDAADGDRVGAIAMACRRYMEAEYTTGFGLAAEILALAEAEIAGRDGCRHTFATLNGSDVCVGCGDPRSAS
jgi:hypothetical protein